MIRFLLGTFLSTLTIAALVSVSTNARASDDADFDSEPVVHRHHRAEAPVVKKARLEKSGILISGGDMAIWQKTSDGRSYESLQRVSGRIGYSFVDVLDVYAEYGHYGEHSETGGNVSVAFHHDEYLLWARRMFFEKKWVSEYVAAGLGAEKETVDTTLNSFTTRASGTLQVLGALAGGVRFGTLVQVMLEGRLSFAAGYNPNPEPGVGVQLGFRF